MERAGRRPTLVGNGRSQSLFIAWLTLPVAVGLGQLYWNLSEPELLEDIDLLDRAIFSDSSEAKSSAEKMADYDKAKRMLREVLPGGLQSIDCCLARHCHRADPQEVPGHRSRGFVFAQQMSLAKSLEGR